MTTTTTTPATTPAEPADPRTLAALIAAVPIILVNTLAVIGQCQWAGTHLHWGRPGQALFAGALETTALAVMYLAHTALIEGDSAWRQKTFAYLIACGSASVNWQEHAADWHPTPAAFVFAGASLLSPILWATYSRFAARSVMRDAGLIDRRAAKFSVARWAMFPRRTFAALRYSVWHSVQSPAAAIAGSQAGHGAPGSHPATTPTAVDTPATGDIPAPPPHPLAVTPANDTPATGDTPRLDDTPARGVTPEVTPRAPAPRATPKTRTAAATPRAPSVTVPLAHDLAADLAILDADGPPAWTDMPKAEAIRRVDDLLPGRVASHVVALLAARGVTVDKFQVRGTRSRRRRSDTPAGGTPRAEDDTPEGLAS